MAFGDSGVLDNFNRADGGLGSNWTTGLYSGTSGLNISSNQAEAGSDFTESRWTANTFNADQEVFVTLAVRPANGELCYVWTRAQSPGTSNADGYQLAIAGNAGGTNHTWTVSRVINEVETSLDTRTQTVANGDAFGLRVTGTGSTVTLQVWYRASGGSWTQLGADITDTNGSRITSTGPIGLGGDGSGSPSTFRYDDFGGGNLNDGTFVQEGFRWRQDDGSESAATWDAAQDTSITQPGSTNRRLRVLVDTTGDQPSTQFQLEYRLSTNSVYVPLLAAAPSAPAFQAAGTAASGTGNVSPAWPAHQAGDIGLLFVESTGGQAAALGTAAGFAEIANSPSATGSGTAGTRLTVFWCRATSSSQAAPTVTDPGDHAYAQIITFRGCIAEGNPWDVTAADQKASASTSASSPSVTTTVDNCLIVSAISRDNDSAAAAFSAWTNSNLTSLTEQSDAGATAGNGGGFGVATGVLATAGSAGSTTATVTSSINASLTIALRPQTTPFLLQTSSNIAASGEATTAQLTAPSGKSTSDFVAGRIQDDENPADAVNITADDYTELEWCIRSQSSVVNAQVYQFRVSANGTALNTYSVTPQWTIGASIVAPDVVANNNSIYNPQINSILLPAVVDSIGSIPSPTVTSAGGGGETLQPGVVDSTSSVLNPTITSIATLQPSVVSSSSAVHNPEIASEGTVTPSVVSSGGSVPSPSLRATIAPSVVGSTAAINSPAVLPAQRIRFGGTIRPRGEEALFALKFSGATGANESKVSIPLYSLGAGMPVNVGNGSFSVKFRFRCRYADNTATDTDVRYTNIIIDHDVWGLDQGWCIGIRRVSGTSRLCFGSADNGWTTITGSTSVGDDTWHEGMLTRNGSTGQVRVWVDGAIDATGTYDTTDWSYQGTDPGEGSHNSELIIGGEKHGVGVAFNGYVEEVLIANTVLATSTYTPTSKLFEPDGNTVGLYRFNRGSGTTIEDESGKSGNDTATFLTGGTPSGPQWAMANAPYSDGDRVSAPTLSAVVSISPSVVGSTASALDPLLRFAIAPAVIANDSSVLAPLVQSSSTIAPGIVGPASVANGPVIRAVIASGEVASQSSVSSPSVLSVAVIAPGLTSAISAVESPLLAVTITPSVVTGGSVPNPAISSVAVIQLGVADSIGVVIAPSLAAVIAPSVISGSTVQAPSLTSIATLQLGVVSSTAQVMSPAISTANGITPDVVASGGSVPNPSLTSSAVVAIDVVSNQASATAPVVTSVTTIAAVVVNNGAGVTAPQVNALILAGAVSSGSTVGTLVLTSQATIQPGGIGTGSTVPDPALSAAGAIVPDVVGPSSTIPSPVINSIAVVQPAIVSNGATVNGAGVVVVIAPGVTHSGGTVNPVTVITTSFIQPDVAGPSSTVYSPALSAAGSITPDVVGPSSTISGPAITSIAVVQPAVVSNGASVQSVSAIQIIAPSVIGSSATVNTVIITSIATIQPGVVGPSAQVQTVALGAVGAIAPDVVGPSSSVQNPTITSIAVIQPGEVSNGAAPQAASVIVTIAPSVVASTATVQALGLTSIATISPAVAGAGAVVYDPEIASQGVVSLGIVGPSSTVYGPSIVGTSVVAVNVVPATSDVPNVAIGLAIAPGRIEALIVTNTVQVHVTLRPDVVSVDAQPLPPQINAILAPSVAGSTAVVPSPSLAPIITPDAALSGGTIPQPQIHVRLYPGVVSGSTVEEPTILSAGYILLSVIVNVATVSNPILFHGGQMPGRVRASNARKWSSAQTNAAKWATKGDNSGNSQ